jgi:nitrogenase iron protein NifH
VATLADYFFQGGTRMLKIAIYGKGGIGKSTTASNLSAAFSDMGYRVMQIGCDPKADSTQSLCGIPEMPTVLDAIREKKDGVTLADIVVEGPGGVYCVESGGPTPGIGCAGRGIIAAFNRLEALSAYTLLKPDIVLYDVLGDVVCGGFAMPLRGGYADYVFVVTSGEKMALYAARNIAAAIGGFKNRGYASLAGLIVNSRDIEGEVELVERFAKEINTQIVHVMPRHSDVQKAEAQQRTVVEAFPASPMSREYRRLAEKVLAICGGVSLSDKENAADAADKERPGSAAGLGGKEAQAYV